MKDRTNTQSDNSMALGVAGVVGAAVGVAATALLTDRDKRDKVKGWLGGAQQRTKELASDAMKAVGSAAERTKNTLTDASDSTAQKVRETTQRAV